MKILRKRNKHGKVFADAWNASTTYYFPSVLIFEQNKIRRSFLSNLVTIEHDQMQTISFDGTAQTPLKGSASRMYLFACSFVKSTSFDRVVRNTNNWPRDMRVLAAFIIHSACATREIAFIANYFYPIRWSGLWL